MVEGARERKRRLTRQRIESAAVGIAHDEGVDAVTVERVCAAAGVSRSTFFNYFPSLDEAIYGSALQYDTETAFGLLDAYRDDLVTAACRIVSEAVQGDPTDEVARLRYALVVRQPITQAGLSRAAHQSQENLVAVITRWLDEHPALSRDPDGDHAAEARLVVAVAVALGDEVQRHAREVDGQVVITREAFATARRRLSTVAAMTSPRPSSMAGTATG